jgi:hypothetical protein
MADSLIQKLEYEAFRSGIQARTKQSQTWFRNKLKEMGNINRQSLLKDSALTKKQRFGVGNMYMFFYDPKHRDTLPYYDAFPLVIMVDRAPGGFYGLNLHYLHPTLRAKLMDQLLDITNNKRFDETTKFKLSYQVLKSANKLKAFQPCFKHYLTKQVDSQIAMVEAPEWEIAMFMPTEQFRKKNARSVWAESRRSIK